MENIVALSLKDSQAFIENSSPKKSRIKHQGIHLRVAEGLLKQKILMTQILLNK
jgi:hypothetical protein